MFDKVHWLIHCQFRMVLLLASYISEYYSPYMPDIFYTYRISASWVLVGWLSEDCRVWDIKSNYCPISSRRAPRDKGIPSCIRPEVLKADLETPRSNWGVTEEYKVIRQGIQHYDRTNTTLTLFYTHFLMSTWWNFPKATTDLQWTS